MSDLRKGLISERKLKLIITQLNEHHSLSSIFTNYIYYDILGSVTIHLRVHWCRFENLPICSYSYENNTLKFEHS